MNRYDLFGGAVNRNNFYFLILLFTSLHVSASTGHPQVKYTWSFLKTITPTTDPFLGYTVSLSLSIYIYIFFFFFIIMLYNILYLKFKIKIADNVLKIDIYIQMLAK
jgi:hypothetical protein